MKFSTAGAALGIELNVSIDGVSMEAYWDRTIDSIFAFADVDHDGLLDESEIRFVPSARAIHFCLDQGFVPPVAKLKGRTEVLAGAPGRWNPAMLKRYYTTNGVGEPRIGQGELRETKALTTALLDRLNFDGDSRISRDELLDAPGSLRQLDTNDNELIEATEILPNSVYPSGAATDPLRDEATKTIERNERPALTIDRSLSSSDLSLIEWKLSVAKRLGGPSKTLSVSQRLRCDAWTVPGPLADLLQTLQDELPERVEAPPGNRISNDSTSSRDVNGRWLIEVADRDSDGRVSASEMEQWMALQRRIGRGQVLISILHGGGLFELLDSDHDGGLSVRELRNGSQMLDDAGCIAEGKLQVELIPEVVLVVASQGVPRSLAKRAHVDVAWFATSDRNGDGDVSRREFTGPSRVFQDIDLDRDGLLSLAEAVRFDALIADQRKGPGARND
ncbi:hypothetical protein [Roseiconus nitratireducens]|uniref:hypothetical protein n=1 Tax=Roseiconus nitratireducens TaxID=2605748 RepID=UPI0013764547|nr:hypothetical protein [Roseiconus nitratireducens]